MRKKDITRTREGEKEREGERENGMVPARITVEIRMKKMSNTFPPVVLGE
jgi:hypothetical protein